MMKEQIAATTPPSPPNPPVTHDSPPPALECAGRSPRPRPLPETTRQESRSRRQTMMAYQDRRTALASRESTRPRSSLLQRRRRRRPCSPQEGISGDSTQTPARACAKEPARERQPCDDRIARRTLGQRAAEACTRAASNSSSISLPCIRFAGVYVLSIRALAPPSCPEWNRCER